MLAISPHTVHTHVRTVYRKLAVGTRAEAALAASRLGLVLGDRLSVPASHVRGMLRRVAPLVTLRFPKLPVIRSEGP